MKQIKNISTKTITFFQRVINIFWIAAIAVLGLYLIDIIQLPVYIVKTYSFALMLIALVQLYKSSK